MSAVVARAQTADEGDPQDQEAPRRLRWNAAADKPPDAAAEKSDAHNVRADIPILAYTYTAYGAVAKTVGAQGYGAGLFASRQSAVLGGGATVWGSPVDRLTLVVDAQRNVWGNFSPS